MKLRRENSTVVAYVRKQEETVVGRDCSGQSLTAVYLPGIPGSGSVLADNFKTWEAMGGHHGVPESTKLPSFYSWMPHHRAMGWVALSIPCDFPLGYVFPLIPLIQRKFVRRESK